MSWGWRGVRVTMVALLLALAVSACGKKEVDVPPAPETPVFSVLATTDLRDAQALEGMVEKATGVKLRFSFGGTMESTEAVLSGSTPAHAAWFANAKYLLSDPYGQSCKRRSCCRRSPWA